MACLKTTQRSLSVNDKELPPPIPPLPLNYQRSDGEFDDYIVSVKIKNIFSFGLRWRKLRNERLEKRTEEVASDVQSIKTSWVETVRKFYFYFQNIFNHQRIFFSLRIAQEIKREQDEIDLKIKDLETRGVELEKMLRGEGQNMEQLNESGLSHIGSSDEDLLKGLLDIWRNITQLKKRDEELIIRQQELQLEHRHAQLKEELSLRLSCSSEWHKVDTIGKF